MKNYPKIESFANGIAIIDFGPEFKKKEILYSDDYVKANTLDNPVFLDYLKGFTPDPIDIVNVPTTAVVNYGAPILYVPSYLMQYPLVADEVTRLVNESKIIIGSNRPDYVLRLTPELDIQEHQNILSEYSDNYIYFYNRAFFLRHLTALSLSFGIGIVEPIKYCTPLSINDITAFIKPDVEYLVYQTLQFDKAITLNSNNIVEFFTDEKINQNITNANFISMRPDRQSWCIEEKYIFDKIATGYAYRPQQLRVDDYARGIDLIFDDVINEDKNDITLILSCTFYFYGSPFKINYKKLNGKYIVGGLDLSINVNNPRIEQIYTSTNLPV